jgi:adenylate cyclase
MAPSAETMTVVLAGTVVALIAALAPAGRAAALTVAALVAAVAVNLAVWSAGAIAAPLAGPMAAMVGAFAATASFRQLSEQRQKRLIRGMFSQALSDQLVDRLVEDPTMIALGGQRRRVSCLFSDLAGFTSISERIGEQETVALLNRWFDHVGSAIRSREGYVNKFLGDGVFALFGAPAPAADHAERALRAALDLQAEAAEVNRELAEDGSAAAGRLAVRVGVTTGEAMVGNCGSSSRLDYTAIGDTVNLASRLESANKFFATAVLCDEPSWREGGAGLVARPLGPVIVVGKQAPVRVYEVLGRAEALDEATVEAAAAFADGVRRLEQGDAPAASEQFARARDGFGEHDRPCAIYLARCREAIESGQPIEPALRLGEK